MANPDSQDPVPADEILKSKKPEDLVHPSSSFFKIFQRIETIFQRHQRSADVYKLSVKDFAADPIPFPCPVHGRDIISMALNSYLRGRMQEYAHSENSSVVKKARAKKKVVTFEKN